MLLVAGTRVGVPGTRADAQSTSRGSALVLPTSLASDRARLRVLAGDTLGLDALLVRSPSAGILPGTAARFAWLAPDLTVIANSAVPFSENDGALWAGRGANYRATGGIAARWGGLRLLFVPELDVSTNADFVFNRDWMKFYVPSVPAARYGDGFANPWYVMPYSADLPWRFGRVPFGRLVPGQTGAWYQHGLFEFGATTENAWWGPGIRDALIMSDNAAGIPRLEFRSAHPVRTRNGVFQWRWFSGALSESPYFDTNRSDDVRSLAAAVVTWRPPGHPTLTLGASRAVYGTVGSYAAAATHWLDIFRRSTGPAPASTSAPGGASARDSALAPGGRAQLASLFVQWVLPRDGFESYAEWGRQQSPRSLRDFLLTPSHSQAYTLGLQWRRPAPVTAATMRIQAEVTNLEQDPTYRDGPIGIWYTSRTVIQGYTQLGQPIGAAIGPGGSSQWLAVDRIAPQSSLGITFRRIRWNEDVRSTHVFPTYLGYCNHDVSVLFGARGGHTLGGGYISGEVTTGDRLNAFFQSQSGCPTGGPSKVDLHPVGISVSFTPFLP